MFIGSRRTNAKAWLLGNPGSDIRQDIPHLRDDSDYVRVLNMILYPLWYGVNASASLSNDQKFFVAQRIIFLTDAADLKSVEPALVPLADYINGCK